MRWRRDREEYHFYPLFCLLLLVNASTSIDNRMHSKRRDVLRRTLTSLLYEEIHGNNSKSLGLEFNIQ
jgi:hypothetical protein